MVSINQASGKYIESISQARSKHTARAYGNGMKAFIETLSNNGINPDGDITGLNEDAITLFSAYLKRLSTATESQYTTAVIGFYEYLEAERIASINLARVKLLARKHNRRAGIRIPKYPADEIGVMLAHIEGMEIPQPKKNSSIRADHARMLVLRDKALILTLADTGLRIHEACNLRFRDMDIENRRAVVIGKGNKQAVVLFSARAMDAITDYLEARSPLESMYNGSRPTLPVFARHDRGAGLEVKPITTTAGYKAITEMAREILGDEHSITPHKFRHYFVTTVLRGSGNLKLAQELARHANISTTAGYAHLSMVELESGYGAIFSK